MPPRGGMVVRTRLPADALTPGDRLTRRGLRSPIAVIPGGSDLLRLNRVHDTLKARSIRNRDRGVFAAVWSGSVESPA